MSYLSVTLKPNTKYICTKQIGGFKLNYVYESDRLGYMYDTCNNSAQFYLPESGNIHEYFTEFYHKAVVSAQFIKDFFLTGRLTPIHSEFIVYNDQIAGQIDMIAKDRNDNFYILDFKTNEKIDYNSYDKKMLGDLSFLNDASYWHYCLQLSIYKELIKEYKVNQIYIVHITTEKYEFIKCEDVLQKISLEQIINQKL